jgi:site-specific recombinase XerC
VQYTQVDDAGRKQRLSRLFPTKTEGKTFLQSLRHGTKVEAARQKKELTLGGWVDWLAKHDWPEELDEKTIGTRVGRFNKHLRERLGGVPLTKLDALTIRAVFRELRDAGVGQPTLLALKANMVRVFNQALSPYHRVPLSQPNPFRLTLQAAPPREAVALTPQEVKKALANENLDTKERAKLSVYLLAGLRLSEQMALTRGQLLFEQDLILVDRAVRLDQKGRQSVGLPKGDKKRLAVMCPTLKKLLLAATEGMEAEQYVWSAVSKNVPKMKKRTYDAWAEIVRKTGLPAETSPHDCRLSHINFIEKLMPEVSATTLKEHVGHAGEGVTEVNYTRPLTASQKILRDSIERVCVTGQRTPVRRRRDRADA